MVIAERASDVKLTLKDLGSTGETSSIGVLEVFRGPYVDTTGISISSDREEELAGGIDFDYRACPYHDSPSRFPNGKPHYNTDKQLGANPSGRKLFNYAFYS